MTCWAVVPIKARANCKTRLRSVLSGAARLALVRSMARHVLTTAAATPGIDRVALLSPERNEVPDDVTMLCDDGHCLNAALQDALPQLMAEGATKVVILPADLPLLTELDIALLMAASDGNACVLAPDHLGHGTNAIALTLPTPFRFQFGADSFARHRAEADALHLPLAVVRSFTLENDLDDPAWAAQTSATRNVSSLHRNLPRLW